MDEGCNSEEFDKIVEGYNFFNFIIEKDVDGNTPIHIAARLDHTNLIFSSLQYFVINLVFGFGGDRALQVVNSRNKEGKIPLHLAVEGGNSICVTALADRNFYSIADVSVQDNNG
ncbi:MAG: ankyrin repeat domain-containing protein [Wolbachia sp.]|nr:ankyrin repeat domain-containing protein [Wolbachia sp.]MDD9336429.1 ankyrin repeat domain-containing protein [Wolbachia sp.]